MKKRMEAMGEADDANDCAYCNIAPSSVARCDTAAEDASGNRQRDECDAQAAKQREEVDQLTIQRDRMEPIHEHDPDDGVAECANG
jgi:hypothetical protein